MSSCSQRAGASYFSLPAFLSVIFLGFFVWFKGTVIYSLALGVFSLFLLKI